MMSVVAQLNANDEWSREELIPFNLGLTHIKCITALRIK